MTKLKVGMIGGGGDDYLFGHSAYGTVEEVDSANSYDTDDAAADLLIGQTGNDFLFGNKGADDLRGEENDDTIYGNWGNDNIEGGIGDDTAYGGRGEDLILGQSGSDHLHGDEGDDVWLVIPDGNGGVATIVDDVHFGASSVGESFVRVPGGIVEFLEDNSGPTSVDHGS